MQEIVNKKNIDALHESIKHERKRTTVLENEVEQVKNSNAMLQNDIMNLRQQLVAIANR